jgi:hypothetical protein
MHGALAHPSESKPFLGDQWDGFAYIPRAFTLVQLLSATTSASHPPDHLTARPLDASHGVESSMLNTSEREPARCAAQSATRNWRAIQTAVRPSNDNK